MKNEPTASSQSSQGQRLPYEAPAIEESASFERLALGCNMLPGQEEEGCLPMVNSSPL